MRTYHIITIGCQMNKSDSERIAGYLEELGYSQSDNKYQADLVVVNTCGVRQSAEDRVYGIVPRIKKENPAVKIILAGCLSERKDVQQRLKNNVDIWLPIIKIPNLKFQITNKFKNPKFKIQNSEYLKIRPKYQSKFSAFVPIGNGCNNFCSYCVVPYARGREVYRPVEDIINEVQSLVKNGYKEIVLIAQNVNSYLSKMKSELVSGSFGRKRPQDDNEIVNFTQLLRLVNDIDGDFWIRFATSHPKDISDELIKVVAECTPSAGFRAGKVCEHIHLPVQAGDNKVLKAMNRSYTIEHYRSLIKKIRQAIPGASITTDVIVGFPGESREQFNNTVKLFKEIKFDMAYIAQYSPRPDTAAAKLKDTVSREEKKKREEELMKILRITALENNKKYIGQTVEILVGGINKKGEWYGRTRTNKNVKIAETRKQENKKTRKQENKKARKQKNKKTNLAGKFVRVKIIGAQDFGLEGYLIE
jgi:tRNA-2-methylthio-N6-dimethylallyladenosine synthase